ncbi:MAG TPA: hypothetical protein VJ822_13615 [Dongiaceae bacterium]|nr:hypothetical protein [Dongiaceae bacterium]
MIFVEYIRHRPHVPLAIASHHAPQDWASDEDVMFANLGRTMKLGPEPTQMCWWQISGLARVDAWERHLHSEAGRLYRAESPVPAALDFYRFGMFDLGHGDKPPAGKLHIAEFFDSDAVNGEQLRAVLEERRQRHAGTILASVVTRIGKLGPAPGGIALWSVEDYVAAEPVVRDETGHRWMHVLDVGLYRDIGREIP